MSDAYEKQLDLPELELCVTVYNINYEENKELLEACKVLKEYAQYVAMVRKFAMEKPLAEAVEQAVDTCIKNGILEDFLRKNRAEAIEMSIFEYDEEKHLTSEREIWRQEGILEGRQEGESRLAKLLELMLQGNKKDNVEKALADAEYREKLYKEYHL